MKNLIFILLLIFVSITVVGQVWPIDSFAVKFGPVTFESHSEGQYSDWRDDWFQLEGFDWFKNNQNTLIVDLGADKCMQGSYPEDTHTDYDNHGFKTYSYFDEGQTGFEEIYWSQNVMLRPYFRPADDGKFPSLRAGTPISNPPLYDDGANIGIVWKSITSSIIGVSCYVYSHNPVKYWQWQLRWKDPNNLDNNYTFDVTQDKWVNLTIRVVMNTTNTFPTMGDKNGIYEGYIDGKLALSVDTIIYRNVDDIMTDFIRWYSAFGGKDTIDFAERDEWIRFDDAVAWQYHPDVDNVVRGNNANTPGTILHLPAAWLKGVQADTVSPVISGLTGQIINEGETFVNDILDNHVTDPSWDQDETDVIWTSHGSDSITVDITSRIAEYTFLETWTGTETFYMKAADIDGNADSVQITMTVEDTIPDVPPGTTHKMLVNFHRYDYEAPDEIINNEQWNHLNTYANEVGDTASLVTTLGGASGIKFKVESTYGGSILSNNSGSQVTAYPDSCEKGQWRLDATGDSAVFLLTGFTPGNYIMAKVLCNYDAGDKGVTQVTFLDTAKTINTYQNDSIFEWFGITPNDSLYLSYKAVGDWAFINILEIRNYYYEPPIDTNYIVIIDTLQAEHAHILSPGLSVEVIDPEINPDEFFKVAGFHDGDWIRFSNADFEFGDFDYIKIKYTNNAPDAQLSVHLDSIAIDSLGVMTLDSTDNSNTYSFQEFQVPKNLRGADHLYIKKHGNGTTAIDWIEFYSKIFSISNVGGYYIKSNQISKPPRE